MFLLINLLNLHCHLLTLPAVKGLIRLETRLFLGEQIALDIRIDDKFTTIYY